jgi:D-alanyl-D-alanine carboxypeptidase (penicillin-binding protein 5/6)
MQKKCRVIAFLIGICVVFAGFGSLRADAAWTPPTVPTCRSVFLVNADTGTVMYEKNADEKVYPASITKLMTAILTMQKYKDNLNAAVTVTQEELGALSGTSSSLSGLKAGEQLTVEQLLYCLLLPSGNDAAVVLAGSVGGSIEKFVSMMNAEAKKIGATHTHYVNPHGLQDPEQYTTARDVYLIAKEAMSFDELAKIVATWSYDLPSSGKSGVSKLINTNKLLNTQSPKYYYKYVKGIKTGTTSQAGACLASYAEKDGYTYYCVAMGGTETSADNTALSETKSLYQWAFGNFEVKDLLETTDPQAQVKVDLAWNIDHILLVPSKAFTALVPDNYDSKQLKVTLPKTMPTLRAPIRKGQKVCTAEVSLDGRKLGTVELVANQSVALSKPLFFVYLVGKFFSSIWFKVVVVLLTAILVLYLVLGYYYNRRRKTYNRRRTKYKLPK